MANMFEMLKNAASMKSRMKEIQKELANQKVESSNGWVSVVARGDMTIESVQLREGLPTEERRGDFETAVAAAVNDALARAKKKAGSEMSKMMGGMPGLGGMLS